MTIIAVRGFFYQTTAWFKICRVSFHEKQKIKIIYILENQRKYQWSKFEQNLQVKK